MSHQSTNQPACWKKEWKFKIYLLLAACWLRLISCRLTLLIIQLFTEYHQHTHRYICICIYEYTWPSPPARCFFFCLLLSARQPTNEPTNLAWGFKWIPYFPSPAHYIIKATKPVKYIARGEIIVVHPLTLDLARFRNKTRGQHHTRTSRLKDSPVYLNSQTKTDCRDDGSQPNQMLHASLLFVIWIIQHRPWRRWSSRRP